MQKENNMEGFLPGQPMFTKDQTEATIAAHFDRSLPVAEQQIEDEVNTEEVVQIPKAEYERLMSTVQVPEQQPTTEQIEVEDNSQDVMSTIDELFRFIEMPVANEEQQANQEPVAEKVEQPQNQPMDRLKEDAKVFYSETGRIARERYGLSEKQTVDIVTRLTPDDLAQIAYAKVMMDRDERVASIPKVERPIPKSTIVTSASTKQPVSNSQSYERQRNPFTE